MNSDNNIETALASIFSGIDRLRNSFAETNRKFTIDGRLVGDIGEVLAGRDFQIKLDEKSQADYDGYCEINGTPVQIKATFQDALTFKKVPEIYLGLKLHTNGSYDVVYNGSGQLIFDHFSHRKGIGKKLLRFPIKVLKDINSKYEGDLRLQKRST